MSFKLTHFWKRTLEIFPGALSWFAIIGPIFLSIWWPWLIAIYILIFDMYWFFRSVRLSLFTIITYRKMRRAMLTDWRAVLESGDVPTHDGDIPLVASKLKYDEIYQVIVLVHYKEPLELLERSINSYCESSVPANKLWLILAQEERAGKEFTDDIFKKLHEKFGHRFGKFIQTIHPAGLPGEIKCKSANATWGGKKLKSILDEANIDYDKVLVHNFDSDTTTQKNYFDYVTYKYLITPLGQPTSYQPIPLYSNNIWDVPAMMRVVAQSCSMVLMYNSMRPFWFQCFSCRSDVFKTIVDINFWAVDAIPEDSRQYFDSYFYYKGKIVIEPLHIPLRLDAVLAEGYWRTIVNQYNQLRRWAWGIVDFPYVIEKSLNDHEISWWHKLGKIGLLLQNHFTRAVAAVQIAFLGWMPGILNPDFMNTVLGYNLQYYARWILSLALIGTFIGIALNILLLPPRPPHKGKLAYFNFIWQWLLVPVVSLVLGSVSAFDAQTRLMFGKYLEYQVTEKIVAKN